MQFRFRFSRRFLIIMFCFSFIIFGGCVGKRATLQHEDQVSDVFGSNYLVPKFPKDDACIGYWVSPKGRFVADAHSEDIETRTERSHSSMEQDFAFSVGLGVTGQTFAGPGGHAGIDIGDLDRTQFQGLEIITPENLAEISFEPNTPYVTEAMRLTRYDLASKDNFKTEAGIKAGTTIGIGAAHTGVGTDANSGTSGDGLVVAYKLEMLDTIIQKKSGYLPLALNKNVSYDEAGLFAKVRLATVKGGSGTPLPYNIRWACDAAEAQSRAMIAAWIIEIKSLGEREINAKIGFPALPTLNGCSKFTQVIDSYQKHGTDTFVRIKANITILDSEVDNYLRPKVFDARIAFVVEEFTIREVSPRELAAK
ncbi:hypothetical protein [Maridesulfovibrio sp.]|uniref:hypothetical protein n=1 Tax=Maridesulfovibrio sp. TaxID=2795000 RepID=UPI0029CA78D2|nr:hypothetical protein [Maridesulfovibrio sp.]